MRSEVSLQNAHKKCWSQWHLLIIPALRRQREEDSWGLPARQPSLILSVSFRPMRDLVSKDEDSISKNDI